MTMGTGTDVVMQSAGIPPLKGDLCGIAKAFRLSRATMRNIRQNLNTVMFAAKFSRHAWFKERFKGSTLNSLNEDIGEVKEFYFDDQH